MKTGAPSLYPNDTVAKRVTDYSSQHSTPLPGHIAAYHASVAASHPSPQLMISDAQAQSHIWLARLAGVRRVLEVGVFVGYSSLVWAHAVGPRGKVTGLEYDAEYARVARDVFEKNGVGNAEVIVGDAHESLSKLSPNEPYDLIFIDAEKSGYPSYLQAILAQSPPSSSASSPNRRLLRPGGLIIADNVLRRGLVADDSADNPYATGEKSVTVSAYQKATDLDAIRQFNADVVRSERLENWLMPLYDGVNVIRLLD